MNELVLGIDIGGTNTAFGLVDTSGKIVYKGIISTIDEGDPETLLQTVFETLQAQKFRPVAVGIGAPNGNSKTGKIEYAPNLSWKGIVEVEAIAKRLWNCSCFLVNDANAAALGELEFGCGQDLQHFVSITLGTGLGSGIVVGGELMIGSNGLAGEYGHISIDAAGRTCGCGRKGCLETYASATGVMTTLAEMKIHSPHLAEGLNTVTTAKELFEAAQAQHPGAMQIVDYTSEKLGYALANYACFTDPEAFILFGGIAQSGAFFLDKVKSHFQKYSLKIYQNVQIRLSSLPASDAAILGAAAAAKQKHS